MLASRESRKTSWLSTVPMAKKCYMSNKRGWSCRERIVMMITDDLVRLGLDIYHGSILWTWLNVKSNGNIIKRTPTWTGPCFWSCFGTITRRWPTYQATWWEEAGAVFRDIGWVCSDGVVGGWCHAPTVSWLQFHALGQGHLVLYALFILLAAGAGARGGDPRVWRHIFRWSWGKREEVWARVATGQWGGGCRRVDGEPSGGAVVQRSLGERTQVPRGSAVVRGDAFASFKPRQRAVQ